MDRNKVTDPSDAHVMRALSRIREAFENDPPRSEDEDMDIAERLEEIQAELAQLNEEAVELAQTIQDNYEGLGL